ncbi:MAG: hypothetical protein R3E95_01000 [Thiolinea sp.]
MSARPLHIALLAPAFLPAWQWELVRRLHALSAHRVSVLVCPQRLSWQARLLRQGLNGLCRIDHVLFRSTGQRAHPLLPVGSLPSIRSIYPESGLPEAEQIVQIVQIVQQESPDLVINLLHRKSWPADLYQGIPAGIWSFCNPADSDLCWTGVRAFTERERDFFSGIQVDCGPDKPVRLLFTGTSSVELSLCQTTDSALWKLSAILPSVLAGVDATTDWNAFYDRLHARFARNWPVRSAAAVQTTAGLLSKACARSLLNWSTLLLHKLLFHRHWILLTCRTETPLHELNQLERAEHLVPPPGCFWADPFLLEWQGRQYVFFEEYVFARKKGHLSCMELPPSGGVGACVRVLERPYHLSYPFLFEYAGQLYMVPESAENHTVDLYRCEHFPERWVWVKTLMSAVEAYDPTLCQHAGRWWMFVNLRHHADSSPHELLYLFSADSPLAEHWEPHPENPVNTYASQARPAGALFTQNGRLYRPSQNCAGSYGRGLNINQIMEWNRSRYREQLVRQYIPAGAASLEGLHTLSFVKGRVVVDGIHVRRRWLSHNEHK